MIPRRRRSAPALHPCLQKLCALAAHAQGCAATPICELCAMLKVAVGAVCRGVLDEADGGGLLGRYETLYKKNKAKADEEIKAYKNSEAHSQTKSGALEDIGKTGGSDLQMDEPSDEEEAKSEPKAKKAKKDPNAPKQPGTGYNLFCEAERTNVRTQRARLRACRHA